MGVLEGAEAQGIAKETRDLCATQHRRCRWSWGSGSRPAALLAPLPSRRNSNSKRQRDDRDSGIPPRTLRRRTINVSDDITTKSFEPESVEWLLDDLTKEIKVHNDRGTRICDIDNVSEQTEREVAFAIPFECYKTVELCKPVCQTLPQAKGWGPIEAPAGGLRD